MVARAAELPERRRSVNTRIAKKIMSQPTDPSYKPSAVLPYTDAQIIEAGRVYRRALARGVKAHPGVSVTVLRFKWAISPASVPKRKRRGERRFSLGYVRRDPPEVARLRALIVAEGRRTS